MDFKTLQLRHWMEYIEARIADIEIEQQHQRRRLEGFPQSDCDGLWFGDEPMDDENADHLDSDSNCPNKLKGPLQ